MAIFGKCNLCKGPVVKINSSSFGQRCLLCRSSPIHRAIGSVVQQLLDTRAIRNDAAAYELSSRGAFFVYMKRRFRALSYSEFYDNVPLGEKKNGVICQDVQQLTFSDESFDIVTSTEVFEHVPDDMKGYLELYRILKPGGYLVFTVPLSNRADTLERARLQEDGAIVHFCEPEYHGDRIRGQNRVLAFRTYGRDLLERLRTAGFEPKLELVQNQHYRIHSNPVFVARKSTSLRQAMPGD